MISQKDPKSKGIEGAFMEKSEMRKLAELSLIHILSESSFAAKSLVPSGFNVINLGCSPPVLI